MVLPNVIQGILVLGHNLKPRIPSLIGGSDVKQVNRRDCSQNFFEYNSSQIVDSV